MFRLRQRAPHVSSSENMASPLRGLAHLDLELSCVVIAVVVVTGQQLAATVLCRRPFVPAFISFPGHRKRPVTSDIVSRLLRCNFRTLIYWIECVFSLHLLPIFFLRLMLNDTFRRISTIENCINSIFSCIGIVKNSVLRSISIINAHT